MQWLKDHKARIGLAALLVGAIFGMSYAGDAIGLEETIRGWTAGLPLVIKIPLGFAGLVFLLGVVHVFVSFLGSDWDSADEDPGDRLRHRIKRVNEAFGEAATLMDELDRDLRAQQAARDALLSQAAEQERLLEIDKEQAERIRQILVGETKATIRAERRTQWMFFALGAAVSIPIGVLINILVP
ncbi:hypothetical protein FXF51_01890 [Nonomuraea sp. PA05]|uniref:hypothetical protein n=1 Tax=Nonomuraea sp. PA05 TaxID=2604466 RepID=UPI0011D4FC85|nr:hypothetical protein [Nonomuraea sp. PA05]TYB71212.1 hypothetical protein FXF51_01890 [Nonomuraea sp. PA05]